MSVSRVESNTEWPPRNPDSRWPRPGLWLAVLGVAVIFGILEGAQGRLQYARISNAKFWPEAWARTLPSWLILAFLFPAVHWVARRFPVDGRNWRISLPVHVLAGGLFVVLHLGGSAWVASLRQVTASSFEEAMLEFMARYLMTDYCVYGAVVGMIQVLHQQSETRRRDAVESSLRADLAEARLLALRNQLNPHFLFNTLNSISALALTGDRATMVRAIDALSGLLRATLDESPGATTRLDVELAILDRYLEIQMIRFGDRLSLEQDIEPETLRAMVPTLILQPIVENAMGHGIAARPGPGRVRLGSRRVDDRLELIVEDSGPGFSVVAEPRVAGDRVAGDGDGREGSSARTGVGLANSRARLVHLYGTQAQLSCSNTPDGGGRVTILIPWTVPS